MKLRRTRFRASLPHSGVLLSILPNSTSLQSLSLPFATIKRHRPTFKDISYARTAIMGDKRSTPPPKWADGPFPLLETPEFRIDVSYAPLLSHKDIHSRQCPARNLHHLGLTRSNRPEKRTRLSIHQHRKPHGRCAQRAPSGLE
jgi:hypothetical protein